jgi:glycosyltransferase involved in cell wall biosynthesis
MTRAIVACMHAYTPFGQEFYKPILGSFIKQLEKYQEEWDKLYIIVDNNWDIEIKGIDKIETIKVDSNLRYYDAYKEALPQIKEDLVLFMDNDMVVYKKGNIAKTFFSLESTIFSDGRGPSDVVSIIDQIGEYQTSQLKNGNKFCPYWFAAKKELLMGYRDIDWGSNMPHSETLGKLTEAMLSDGVKAYEQPEDKSGIMFDGTEQYPEQHTTGGRGYYHVRAGSSTAYLLATKKYGNKQTYDDYIKSQPHMEILRQASWYKYMGGDPTEVVFDVIGNTMEFEDYYQKFLEYHGL